MIKIERWLPLLVLALVFAARLTSLFTGDAPSSKSEFEIYVWVATLPASAVAVLIEERDQYSLGWWSVAFLLWAASAYLQFSLVAAIPRFLSSRPKANSIFTAVTAGGILLIGLWTISRIPSHPEEEPASFLPSGSTLDLRRIRFLLVLSLFRKVQPGPRRLT